MLQKLRCREVSPASEVYVFGNIGYHVYHFLLLVELQSFLRKIAESYRVADVEAPAIRLFGSQEHFYECALAGSVVANDAHLLETCEVIVEIL